MRARICSLFLLKGGSLKSKVQSLKSKDWSARGEVERLWTSGFRLWTFLTDNEPCDSLRAWQNQLWGGGWGARLAAPPTPPSRPPPPAATAPQAAASQAPPAPAPAVDMRDR